LEQFTQLPPSTLELIEKLEQLRALEAGMSIYAVLVSEAPMGIDTPADLIRIMDSVC
jgi:3-deoxy-manno-octulosonate cytidylyltransferase (CMP-KDO synthetase)